MRRSGIALRHLAVALVLCAGFRWRCWMLPRPIQVPGALPLRYRRIHQGHGGQTSRPMTPVTCTSYGIHTSLNGLGSTGPDSPENRAAGHTTSGFSERPANDVAALFYSRWDGKTWTKPNDIALIWWGHALRASLAADARGSALGLQGIGSIDQESLGRTTGLGPRICGTRIPPGMSPNRWRRGLQPERSAEPRRPTSATWR